MAATIFVDGESGTTGLQIRERLAGRDDVRLVSLAAHERRDPRRRADCLNSVDLAVLCLPDDGAREAVAMIKNSRVRVIDASTAHRTHPDWVFGFPEMDRGGRMAIAGAQRVSNPGCYSTGFIALARPLVEAGVIPAAWPLTVHAVSGYTGGGRAMIAEFEDVDSEAYTTVAWRPYGLRLGHKHVPEMMRHAGLAHAPLFSPSVGRFRCGMIVEIPLALWALPAPPRLSDIRKVYREAFAGEAFIDTSLLELDPTVDSLDPEVLNGTNNLRIHVCGSDQAGQARLIAILDNLGKGAAGAAVQNLNLMLGLPEQTGLGAPSENLAQISTPARVA